MPTDTKLDDLIVNSLTREQYHNANFTGHENEVFVQSDHAGVAVGGSGVDALDTTNISNCITNIPQDIKLELNNGTLTLKAGSKVYVPNGAGVFDEVVKDSDLVYNFGTPPNGQYLVFNSQYFYLLSNCVSGATDSKAGQAYHSWYDTTNNLIKQYWADGSTPARTDSLPVAIITISGGVITSIDQVFNGFGYIGSTVFVLPGVKGLIPNGRNEDGSLKNIEVTVGSVSTNDGGGADQQNIYYGLNSSGSLALNGIYSYDSINNYTYDGTTVVNGLFVDRYNKSGEQIIHFDVPTAFRALDYNDTEYIGHQAMPDARHLSFSLPASDGQAYTMPGDGYFYAKANASSNQGTLILANATTSITQSTSAPYQNFTMYVAISVAKGDIVRVYCSYGTVTGVSFHYNKGSK